VLSYLLFLPARFFLFSVPLLFLSGCHSRLQSLSFSTLAAKPLTPIEYFGVPPLAAAFPSIAIQLLTEKLPFPATFIVFCFSSSSLLYPILIFFCLEDESDTRIKVLSPIVRGRCLAPLSFPSYLVLLFSSPLRSVRSFPRISLQPESCCAHLSQQIPFQFPSSRPSTRSISLFFLTSFLTEFSNPLCNVLPICQPIPCDSQLSTILLLTLFCTLILLFASSPLFNSSLLSSSHGAGALRPFSSVGPVHGHTLFITHMLLAPHSSSLYPLFL